MAKFAEIRDSHRDFIAEQKMFFVATAAPGGRVNMAPKGMHSLKVLDPKRILWLNLTGSENETAAHLRDSARMTLMWCSFARKPMILRAYGQAATIHPRDAGWKDLAAHFPPHPGARQILDLSVELVLTSCGFGVPLYDYVGRRDTLKLWADRKGEAGIARFWADCNSQSLDGKPTGILQD